MRKLLVICLLATASLAKTDSEPRCIAPNPEPSYSDLARRAGVAGEVKLSALISREGGVPKSVVVVGSLGWGLDEQAIQAVSQWKFAPAVSGGQAVEAAVPVECYFSGPRTSDGYLSFGAMTFDVPSGASTPELITFVPPDFYPDYGQKHERGKIQFSVNEQGEPENFAIEETSSPNLEKAVLGALRQWRFRPARKDGLPVSARGAFIYNSTPK